MFSNSVNVSFLNCMQTLLSKKKAYWHNSYVDEREKKSISGQDNMGLIAVAKWTVFCHL